MITNERHLTDSIRILTCVAPGQYMKDVTTYLVMYTYNEEERFIGYTHFGVQLDELVGSIGDYTDLIRRWQLNSQTPDCATIDMPRQRLGKRIAQLRNEAGMSQARLAELTGMEQPHIARIEAGRYSVGVDILGKIATALGKRVDIVD